MKKQFIMLFILISTFLVGCETRYKISDYYFTNIYIHSLEYNDNGNVYVFDSTDDLYFYNDLNDDNKVYFDEYNDSFFKKNTLLLVSFSDYGLYDYSLYFDLTIDNWAIVIEKDLINQNNNYYNNLVLIEVEGKVKNDNWFYLIMNENKTQQELNSSDISLNDSSVSSSFSEEISSSYDSSSEMVDEPYNKSAYSNNLTYTTVHLMYDMYSSHMSGEFIYPYQQDFERLYYSLKNNTERKFDTLNTTKDYYTCAYLSNDFIEVLDNDKWLNDYVQKIIDDFSNNDRYLELWTGIDYYLVKYAMYVYYEEMDYDFWINGITWYEIPKEEKIPYDINDLKLICISESFSLNEYSLDDLLVDVHESFIEAQYLYPDASDSVRLWYENFYYDMFGKVYLSRFLNTCIGNGKEGIILPHYLYGTLKSGLVVEEIDGVEYVNLKDDYMFFETDIRKIVNHKTIINSETLEYLFNYEELIDFLSFQSDN